MKHGMVASLTVLLAAGLAWGQSYTQPAGDPVNRGGVVLPGDVQHKDEQHKDKHKDEQHKDDKHKEHAEGAHHESHEHEEEHEEEEIHRYRVWARAEYLLWWTKDAGLPPVASTGSVNDPQPGALFQPGTRFFYGGGPQTQNPQRNGGRFTFGYWLDDCDQCGLEIAYWFLGNRAEGGTFTGSGAAGSTIVARPFFDALAGREDSELVAFPGLVSGSVKVHSSTFLQGGEANAVWCLGECKNYRIDLLAGFRFMQFDDDLDISENSNVMEGAPYFANNNIAVHDHFGTSNYFYGGQLGMRAEFKHEDWFLRMTAKVAIGDVNQSVDINGTTRITPPGGPSTVSQAGLLALPSNSGSHSRDVFGFVPEAGIDIGYAFSKHVRFSVGYTYMYWNDVARAGNQIDRNINVTQVPTSILAGTPGGPNRPIFAFDTTDFWAQGVCFNLEFRY